MISASIYGRLGRDPEVRQTRNGNLMTTASIAVDVTPFNHEGETVTLWVSLAAFGSAGEALARHAKGDCIGVMGRMTLKPWRDRDGAAKESWQLTVDAVHSSRTVRPGGRRKREAEPATETAGAEFDDDIE